MPKRFLLLLAKADWFSLHYTGSPSRGGDVTIYVLHKPTCLSSLKKKVLVSISVVMALSTVFHSINSSDNFPLSDFVLPVLYLPCWSFQL